MMKYICEKKCLVLKVEEKGTVNLYHLVDLDKGDKVTALGVKTEKALQNLDVVTATITLSVNTQKVDTKEAGVKFLQVTKTFISKIEAAKQ